jgi:hypothetical protein
MKLQAMEGSCERVIGSWEYGRVKRGARRYFFSLGEEGPKRSRWSRSKRDFSLRGLRSE